MEIKLHRDLEYSDLDEYETATGQFVISVVSDPQAISDFLQVLKLRHSKHRKLKVSINADGAGARVVGFKFKTSSDSSSIDPSMLSQLEEWRQTLESSGRIEEGRSYYICRS